VTHLLVDNRHSMNRAVTPCVNSCGRVSSPNWLSAWAFSASRFIGRAFRISPKRAQARPQAAVAFTRVERLTAGVPGRFRWCLSSGEVRPRPDVVTFPHSAPPNGPGRALGVQRVAVHGESRADLAGPGSHSSTGLRRRWSAGVERLTAAVLGRFLGASALGKFDHVRTWSDFPRARHSTDGPRPLARRARAAQPTGRGRSLDGRGPLNRRTGAAHPIGQDAHPTVRALTRPSGQLPGVDGGVLVHVLGVEGQHPAQRLDTLDPTLLQAPHRLDLP